jgi:predicted DNA-binding transcriptional regulator YafY
LALPIVQDAVARDRKLAIRYKQTGRERVERTVDPLGLVAKGSTWYLVAATTAGLRTYRVSRIESARLLDSPSQRPADFDLAAYWKTSLEQLREGWRRFGATLRLEPKAAAELRAWRDAKPVDDGGAPAADGWVTLRARFESEEQAGFVVRGLGPRAEVIEPRSLRERVAADAAAVLARLR